MSLKIPLIFSLLLGLSVFSGCSGKDKNDNNTTDSNSELQTKNFRENFQGNNTASTDSDGHLQGDFRLTVTSTSVSSAFVKLNDQEVMHPSDFHNRSFRKTMTVQLFANNTVEAEIRGKPGDQLCVRVFEVKDDASENTFYERCVDRDNGPPNSVDDTIDITRVKLQAVGFNAAPQANGAVLTDARIVLSNFRFQPEEVCEGTMDSRETVDLQGPYVSNLLTGQILPPVTSAYVTSGSYCRVNLKLDQLDTAEIPTGVGSTDPVVGASVIIRGTRSDGVPFVLRVAADVPFKLQNSSGGFPVQGNAMDFFLGVDLSQLFTGVDLTAAVVDTSGTIFLDETHNPTLFAKIKENAQVSARLYRDDNRNGVLEASEREDADILAVGAME